MKRLRWLLVLVLMLSLTTMQAHLEKSTWGEVKNAMNSFFG